MFKSKRIIILLLVTIILTTMVSHPIPANATGEKKVGTWMYTWWTETTDYDWIQGHGSGSTNQLLGDLNGDGKDDAVINFNDGNWYASMSNGTDFNNYSQWCSGHGSGSSKDFLADVNGDGKADAVSYFSSSATWNVALSNGSGFGTSATWSSNFGGGSSNQLMADINGDGKDDIIVFFSNGDWWVATSNGGNAFVNGFKLTSFGSGSSNQMFGDFNGDGKADPMVLWNSVGDWWVGLSNGTSVYYLSKWAAGFGIDSTSQLVGDIDDDGKTDAVAFYSDGTWYKAISSGSAFGTGAQMGGFKENFGAGSTKQFVGNTYGDDRRTVSGGWDKPNTMSIVAFFYYGGQWQVQGLNQYAWMNRWEGWNVKYRQEISEGVFCTYGQNDDDVIDYQLAKLAEAGIDFLIFDETNHLNADDDILLDNALNIADRIRVWNSNSSNKPIKYAIAIGPCNFYPWSVQSIEDEAEKVYDLFVNTTHGGTDNYYYVNGKPLLVVYTWMAKRQEWEDWTGDKTETNQFSVRWAEGPIQHTSDWADYYGWYNTADGPYTSGTETVFVTPRKPNAQTIFAKDLQFYKDSWATAIQLDTDSIVVGGMDDYTEANAIWPTDTSLCDSSIQEQWVNEGGQTDPYVYWNWTKHYINQYKGNRTNIYTNDFESSMTGWSNAWLSFYSWYAYQGTGALAITNGYKAQYTVTGLQPNTTYHVEGFIRKEYNSGGYPTVGVNSHGSSEEEFDTYNNSNAYTMFTFTFTTGASNTSATIFVDNMASGGGHAFLDNIKVFK